MLEIIPFDFETHFEKTYALWQAAFEATWPLDRETFSQIISDAPNISGLFKQRFVALVDGDLAGFVLFQSFKGSSNGNLNLLMVDAQYQRQGIGSALHKLALEELGKAGVERVQLGAGSPTLWQGVPVEMAGVTAFFEKMGWEYSENSYDLIQDLQAFTSAWEFIKPAADRGISFRTANPTDEAAIVAFQKAEFPNWLNAYENTMALGDFNDLALVCDTDGKLLGMVIMFSPGSNPLRLDVPWNKALGENVGALGCVGIAHSLHGQGTGSAMMAYAMEVLKERGAGICHISWTLRVTFYEKLGFKLWESYRMSWRNLS